VANVLFSEGIPAPVLVRSELEAFCRDGDIKESEGSAYSYIPRSSHAAGRLPS